MNDCTFSEDDSGFKRNQFKIFYSVSDNKYYIKDMCNDNGTFIKVDIRIPIKQGHIFTFANFHMSMSYKFKDDPNSDPNKILHIQLYDGNEAKDQ